MPYQKKSYKKNVPKKYYKKKYTPNLGKLVDSKVNTLLEQRMVAIAKKEARLTNPSLCLRKYCWVDYEPFQNKFSPLATSVSNSFDWEGQLVNLTDKIVKADIATVTNNPIPDDLNTQFREDTDRAADGVNILTTMKTAHGRRTGDQIFLTGYSLNHRIICDFTNLDEENQYDKIDIHIGLIKIRREAVGVVVPYTPKDLLRINPWGYHSALDPQIEQENYTYNPIILFRDKVTISNSSEKHNNIVFKNFRGFFPKPIKIDYRTTDINARSANYDVYLVVRSTVASTGDDEDKQSKPYCQTCAKLYYRNNK